MKHKLTNRFRAGRSQASWIILLGLAVAAIVLLPPGSSGGDNRSVVKAQGSSLCESPADISLVFDHSGSMADPYSKLANAKAASIGFIDMFAGGPADNDLTPHHMALTGFSDGVASVDVPLTTNAALLRTAINGYTASGYTHIGRAVQFGQLQLTGSASPPDYMVLLSDGSANRPWDVDDSGTDDDFYIDVNNNGIVDSGDDLSIDYPGGDTNADFVVQNGLLVISGQTARRQALNADDLSESTPH